MDTFCPFGYFHSSLQTGAYAMDAAFTGKGFTWKCHHDHSRHPDGSYQPTTVDMLREAIRIGDIKREAFFAEAQNFDLDAMAYDFGTEMTDE